MSLSTYNVSPLAEVLPKTMRDVVWLHEFYSYAEQSLYTFSGKKKLKNELV